MKKHFLFIVLSVLFGTTGVGQSFNTNNLTWFGIDYTNCYFLTPMDFPNVGDLKTKIRAWNDLVLYERDKYINKTLKGKNVKSALETVNKRNETINVRDHLTDDGFKSSHLDPAKVQEIISSYDIPEGLSGTGLVLIAESYSKPNEQGAYYVAFFDIATKKVFATERMLAKPGGFGLRNYWAKTYYTVLKEVGKKY